MFHLGLQKWVYQLLELSLLKGLKVLDKTLYLGNLMFVHT